MVPDDLAVTAVLHAPQSQLDWLAGLLWDGRDARLVLGSRGPAGFAPGEHYALVPPAGRPRLLVPITTPRAAFAALAGYGLLRPPPRRLARRVLALAGAAQLLPTRATVWFRPGTCLADRAAASLPAHLSALLGVADGATAVTFGTPGPSRTPVAQLLDSQGYVRGFVKIGWNETSRHAVQVEAAALQTLGADPPRRFDVPRLLARGTWRELALSVTSPLPPMIRRHSRLDDPPSLNVTREIARRGRYAAMPLSDSAFWHRIRSRLGGADDLGRDVQRAANCLAARLAARAHSRRLTFGAWHGDWTPWNIGWYGGRMHVWDWEHYSQEVPLGFDLLHWHFQVAFVLRRSGLHESVSLSRRLAGPHLAGLGVEADAIDLLVSLYLLELLGRFTEAARARVGDNPRFRDEIARVLRSRA